MSAKFTCDALKVRGETNGISGIVGQGGFARQFESQDNRRCKSMDIEDKKCRLPDPEVSLNPLEGR